MNNHRKNQLLKLIIASLILAFQLPCWICPIGNHIRQYHKRDPGNGLHVQCEWCRR